MYAYVYIYIYISIRIYTEGVCVCEGVYACSCIISDRGRYLRSRPILDPLARSHQRGWPGARWPAGVLFFFFSHLFPSTMQPGRSYERGGPRAPRCGSAAFGRSRVSKAGEPWCCATLTVSACLSQSSPRLMTSRVGKVVALDREPFEPSPWCTPASATT